MAGEHLIRKQRVVLKLQNKDEMFRLRELLHAGLRDKIWPEMDKFMSDLCEDGQVLRIPHLEVNLGKMNIKSFEQTFPEKLLSQIEVQLRRQASAAGDEDESGTGKTRMATPEENEREAFFFFLKRGYLPWWFGKGKSAGETALELREKLKDIRYQERLFSAFSAFREARVRYIGLASGREAETILFLASGSADHYRELAADLLVFRIHVKISLGISDIDFYERLLLSLSVFGQRRGDAALAAKKAFLQFFMKEMATMSGKDIHSVSRKMQGSLMLEESSLRLKMLDRKFWNEAFSEQESSIQPPSKEQIDSLADNTAAEKSWLVHNAGLILLHPFLPSFLEGMGLLGKDREFASEAAARQAAVLMQYIVKGREEVFEYELLLNKLLCGLSPSTLVQPGEFPLTDEQNTEIEKMLKVVVGYWEALKGSSVAGLREAFLLRDGTVESGDGKMLIRPERKTVDVLVDRLPWGLSVIKLPWLKIPVHVEW